MSWVAQRQSKAPRNKAAVAVTAYRTLSSKNAYNSLPITCRVALLEQPLAIQGPHPEVKFSREIDWIQACRSLDKNRGHKENVPDPVVAALSTKNPRNTDLRFLFGEDGEVIDEFRVRDVWQITKQLMRTLENIQALPRSLMFYDMDSSAVSWLLGMLVERIPEVRGCDNDWKARRLVESVFEGFRRL
ncbi:hypothetical protein SISNIDRAFT_119021 [Sistotremastrum niveocremeum HHB9708]|uniref:Uncharacterized protein n=2 Tax=Sistotremastraceae TaxID=3402574 RepID=A0A164TQ05_9AGAM|nr:hypothetical protein SISNIDRAFT_119021 [Sistotremastrum niveocremeum HHB9708]KZT42214.1 hypothetical protein SISSUDRAFT_113586 [Sistotremastrum suecicum HHB10207 ss-3]